MNITAARVIVACPGHNFVKLKIGIDRGHGIRDATLNGRELSVVCYLQDRAPRLIGIGCAQGLNHVPRLFGKLTKPVASHITVAWRVPPLQPHEAANLGKMLKQSIAPVVPTSIS